MNKRRKKKKKTEVTIDDKEKKAEVRPALFVRKHDESTTSCQLKERFDWKAMAKTRAERLEMDRFPTKLIAANKCVVKDSQGHEQVHAKKIVDDESLVHSRPTGGWLR